MNAVCWAIQNGNWSSASTWAGGVIPDTSGTDLVYTNGFTVAVDININVALLSNAARSRDIATAQMTANNAPSPFVAAANSIFSGSFDAFQAFNRNNAGNTYWATGANITTGWLSMDFGSGSSVIVDGYTIFGSDGQTRNPRNWTFEGSNNNSAWTILHTVSGAAAIPANGSYSIASIGNTTGYRYYRVNISLNGGSTANVAIAELELYRPNTASIAAGGRFNFNTGGVTAIVGGITFWQGSSVTVTNSTGIVTITSASNLAPTTTVSGNVHLDHSGAGDLILSAPNFSVSNPGYGFTMYFLRKSGIGNLTINGNLFGVSGTNASACLLISASGNTVINGNLSNSSAGALITQQGNLTINGNVNGSTSTDATVTNQSAGTFVINGVVYSGTLNYGVTSTNSFTVNGNVICNSSQPAIYSTSNISVTLNGNAYASALANAINLTTGTVYLKGNMYDVLGRVAIYCPNIFVDNTAVSLWEMSVGGGLTKKLYSADTTPNLPVVGNVRDGITYGPASSLTGTMKVPSPSNVRTGVPTDNTVGSATALEAQDIINYISSSSDDLAKRLRRILTTEEAGNLIKNN